MFRAFLGPTAPGRSARCLPGARPCSLCAEVLKLDESYESTALKLSRYELVLNRTWLLHWTLFPIFKSTQPQAQGKAQARKRRLKGTGRDTLCGLVVGRGGELAPPRVSRGIRRHRRS